MKKMRRTSLEIHLIPSPLLFGLFKFYQYYAVPIVVI